MKKGFTLIEILIVVTILGIIVTLAMPLVQGKAEEARVASAKEMLQSLRHQIELYKLQHDGQIPGFVAGSAVSGAVTLNQFIKYTAEDGTVSAIDKSTDAAPYGKYFSKMPKNPFNGRWNIVIVPNGVDISVAADGTSSGWLYKRKTAEIRLNSTGTDERGVKHYDL